MRVSLLRLLAICAMLYSIMRATTELLYRFADTPLCFSTLMLLLAAMPLHYALPLRADHLIRSRLYAAIFRCYGCHNSSITLR